MLLQVAGELSNNGSMMRRFMQTFVLVQQSVKKYYVHSDILRYQDEVFLDSPAASELDETASDVGATLLSQGAALSAEGQYGKSACS